MENLQKSELVIAKVLGLLMEWGLSDSQLEFPELQLGPEYMPFFSTCVEWLESEGVIRTRAIHKYQGGECLVLGPVLTAHGLGLMGNPLRVGEQDSTIGEAVMRTSKETSFYTGIGDISGGFVGGLLKSLGSG